MVFLTKTFLIIKTVLISRPWKDINIVQSHGYGKIGI